MKHQTPDSMKFKKFARRLGLRVFEAAGLLEMLWITTQKNAPRGDIGRYDNESIAIELDWPGDPDSLVQAMLECGWLDESDEYRLVVHDWPLHAPRYIHGVVSRKNGFATVQDCSAGLQSATTVPDCTEVQPNLTKPNLTNSIDRLSDRPTVSYAPIEVTTELFERARPLARYCNERLGDGRPLKPRDREIAIQASVLALERLGEEWLREILGKPQLADRGGVANRWAYFSAACKAAAERLGYDWHDLLKTVYVPRELVEKPPPVPA